MKRGDDRRWAWAGFLALGLGLVLAGCATTGAGAQSADGAVLAGGPPRGVSQAPVLVSGKTKSGSQLWAENCGRCHNIRSPSSYSDDQWEVAVDHMRVRAGLTANESRKITEFLKASN